MDDFEWTTEAGNALEEIKTLMATNLILAAPHVNELMLLYISATSQVASAVLVIEQEEEGHAYKMQRPVYNVSEVLSLCKTRYPHYQKIACAVFIASRKLRHYFQECPITVAPQVPLGDIINNWDAIGQIVKWAIELLPFEIQYQPCRAVKSQVLADFVAEWTEAKLPHEHTAYTNWTMYFEGSKMLAGLGLASSTSLQPAT
jgi:hypothetical protein